MLPRDHRLHYEVDILYVLKRGRVVPSPLVRFFYVKRPPAIPSRFGFVVSKKVSAKTTRRNLVKRRLRAAVATHIKEITPGFDCLFLAKPAILNLPYKTIEQEVVVILQTAKILIV